MKQTKLWMLATSWHLRKEWTEGGIKMVQTAPHQSFFIPVIVF